MLLDRFEITGEERETIERRHRAEIIAISHHRFGRALIRDQKPLSIEGLRRGLTDRSDPYDFLAFLNGRVFFWLSESRLARMTNAAAYRDEERPVLVFDTESVVADYEEKILLSPINSGATKPFPAKRSISMFQPIVDFDFEARRKSADPIVELTVANGLADVSKYLVRQEVWKAGRLIRRL
ncbi:MAG: hypothetical protein IAI50_19100 [Candidatus Eremiobacteraeota bacterium]|nr:hypothetical protein [Candidatus Eremiobacteraeota bacterium]